jgi:hypothetical protein
MLMMQISTMRQSKLVLSKHRLSIPSIQSVFFSCIAGLIAVTLTACAPTTAPGLDVSKQNPPLPPTPLGESPRVENMGRLSLVQVCGPTGGNCTLAFVDSLPADNVSKLVRDYFARTSRIPAPQVSVESNCSPGWVASVMSEQGSVLGGGLLHAQAAVCGHPTPASAINKALDVCDAKTSGGCRKSSRIKVVWGQWTGNKLAGRDLEPGRPYEAWAYAGGMACESPVPIVVSASCSNEAAAMVRAAGVRFP